MVTRMTTATASRLANAPILPLDPGRYGTDFRRHLRDVSNQGVESGLFDAIEMDLGVSRDLVELDVAARQIEWLSEKARAVDADQLSAQQMRTINDSLLRADRAWRSERGLNGRPWYRNLFASPDEDSGYASWMLPDFRVLLKDPERDQWQRANPVDANTPGAAVIASYLQALNTLGRTIESSTPIGDRP